MIRNQNPLFSNDDLDLSRNKSKRNPMWALCMWLLYMYNTVGVNMMNGTKVISQKHPVWQPHSRLPKHTHRSYNPIFNESLVKKLNVKQWVCFYLHFLLYHEHILYKLFRHATLGIFHNYVQIYLLYVPETMIMSLCGGRSIPP